MLHFFRGASPSVVLYNSHRFWSCPFTVARSDREYIRSRPALFRADLLRALLAAVDVDAISSFRQQLLQTSCEDTTCDAHEKGPAPGFHQLFHQQVGHGSVPNTTCGKRMNETDQAVPVTTPRQHNNSIIIERPS